MAYEMVPLLRMLIDREGSDLHLAVDNPPVGRVHGHLQYFGETPLTADDTERLMKSVASVDNQQELQEVGGSDFGFAFEDIARFRVSIFKQKGYVGMVLRLIPRKILTFEEIGLPQSLKQVINQPRGLILVTGPTGSGKSTSLATMIDWLNGEFDHHIITIEDPIEYYHSHKKSIVTQREVGVDVPTFAEALRRALRQDPDVILVGEMRDLETIGAAVTAAETGHLVFGTLHTTGAVRTIDRIVDAFPTNQQEQIRTQLAGNLKSIISQTLLPRKSGFGRVAAFEVMITTPAIQNLIRENKSYRITSAIQTGHKFGMNLLDEHLLMLYKRGIVKYEDCVSKSQSADEFEAAARAAGLEDMPAAKPAPGAATARH
ncbi:MAG TPA: type IV pilus twitching motility protein PilT [Candidatus Hydrogenedentes bacterium]|nr:type IV pilus twitching motility protein PilT [Candidatus Hydrogenedentota bacterium]HOS02406.1 type IV pilus twitching motility protein PilT [Candidatus Hydrogenedentota bacterium]